MYDVGVLFSYDRNTGVPIRFFFKTSVKRVYMYLGDSPVTRVTAREIFPDIWIVCRYLVCRISKPLCMLGRVSRQA